MLTYSVPNSGLPVPIKIKTYLDFAILIDEVPICLFGRNEILCRRSIDIDQHSIKNVKNLVDRLDAVNKAYADRIKYKTDTVNIPNTVMTDHILFTFPAAKAFASGKIKICEMWVERLADEWIATSSLMFATEWPGFKSPNPNPNPNPNSNPNLTQEVRSMTFFTGSPSSGWTRNFSRTATSISF